MLISYSIHFDKKNESKSVTSHLSNHVRSLIKNDDSLFDEKRNILLTYPIVYIHAWKNYDGSISVYIGETNDLLLRIDQHTKSFDEKKYWDWHNQWLEKIDEGNAFSWFFSGKVMNKSLCLDIENSLFTLMSNNNLNVTTMATQKQSAYSNKSERNGLLQEIWSILRCSDEFSMLGDWNNGCLKLLTKEKYKYCDLPDSLQMCVYTGIEDNIQKSISEKNCEWMLNYPVLYVYLWIDENGKKRIYVGETDNCLTRHEQHLKNEEWTKSWNNAEQNQLIIFCHRDFNKSMTLDLENRLIIYMTYLKLTENRRYNEQGNYNGQDLMFPIFCEIIEKLLDWQSKDKLWKDTFITIDDLKKKCVSLVSFYKLNDEQVEAKGKLLEIIKHKETCDNTTPIFIILYGGAGTGKTVLLSSLLFDLVDAGVTCAMVVNNKELAPSYQKMMNVRNLGNGNIAEQKVYYAADFFSGQVSYDVVLVDEGHLLNVRDHSGRAKSQLDVIADHANVTVLVFDPEQFVDKNKKWDCCSDSSENIRESFCDFFRSKGKNLDVRLEDLNQQMRMQCEPATRDWINAICTGQGKISALPREKTILDEKACYYGAIDQQDYEIRVYSDPVMMKKDYQDLRKKDKDSMIIATYDWKYGKEDSVQVPIPPKKDYVVKYIWHNTGDGNSKKSVDDELSLDSWIRNAKENEIGSIHDIQGFDLKYAFVVIGPSISYDENGIKVIGRNHRKNHDPELILNELRVLLTRGVKGLYLYACNDKLRDALINVLKEE